jgi:hypothetical protein
MLAAAFRLAQPCNWFDTLNGALASEGLLESWNFNGGIGYGEHFTYIWENGTEFGRFVQIYRDQDGRYERPVTYNC